MKNKERKKDQIIEEILKQGKEYRSRKHLIELKKQPLSDEEIREWIKDIKQTIDANLKWITIDNEKIIVEAKRTKHWLRYAISKGVVCETEKLLTCIDLAEMDTLYARYKYLSKKEISTSKRKLTLTRDELEIYIYKRCIYRQETLDKVVPCCIEYLEVEYQKYYDVLDKKTETVKENRTTVKKELESLKEKRFNR